MGTGHRCWALAACVVAASSMASGYYNWIYFASDNAPFTPVPARFDLNALSNNTVSYFISDQPPSPLMPGDTFPAIVSQIKAAAAVWNQVPSSTIRIAFGGISTIGAIQQAAPGIDVVFDDDMPPGLLAQTRITVTADLSPVANGATFVPIQRSRVQFRHDFTANSEYSGGDLFFMTAAHEFGHALGLQHSLTSSIMSTAVTRATTKAAPLAADDVAGISMLYPASGFMGATGSISGAVTLGGTGVNLASVVAVSANGVAISNLTNPDGTYRIRGIPPGQYYVYAHPLPPPMTGEAYPDNVIPPVDTFNNPFPANTGFDTEFFPGTKDWTRATLVSVGAAADSGSVNFSMQARSSEAIPYVLAYGYQGQVPVPSPPIQGGTSAAIVFYAPGTTSNTALVAGVNVSSVGGPVSVRPGSLQYYTGTNGYAYFMIDTAAVTSATPVALAVSLPNDLYVLPAALSLVPGAPPSITSVSGTGTTSSLGTPVVNIAGANIGSASTRVMFDGAPAPIFSVNTDGSLNVAAPPASGAYVANVEALTTDGQTSQQGLGSSPIPTFTYSAPANPSISVTPANLLPGTDAMLEIDGTGTDFVTGSVAAGFGSSDITVKHLWVLGLGRLMMNVSVKPQAKAGSVEVTVASGLQLVTLTSVMQVQTARPDQISLIAPVLNQATGQAGTPAGGNAVVAASGLPSTVGSGWTLTVGGQLTSISVAGGQIYFSVPSGLPVGVAPVQLTAPNGNQIPPILMQIDPPPPVILAATSAAGTPINQSNQVRAGDTVILTVTGLLDASGNPPAASSVVITIGTVNQVAVTILPTSTSDAVQVEFVVPSNAPLGPNEPLTVTLGTLESVQPFTIPIRS